MLLCFGSEEAVQEVWRLIGSTLLNVDAREHAELASTVAHLTQFLVHLVVQPSLSNGEQLRNFLHAIQQSIDVRGSWPKDPLEDPRNSTVLEGANQIIFEHPSEGLIRLQWVNPLPMPDWLQHGGYQCDICLQSEDLLLGYQHVTEDNSRDLSSFMACRIGYDVCGRCAVKHVSEHRECLQKWLGDAELGATKKFIRPCAAKAAVSQELRLEVVAAEQSLELLVEGTAGLCVSVAVLPMEEDKNGLALLPRCWFGAGTVTPDTPKIQPQPEPAVVPMEFTCARGDRVRIWAGTKRGTLFFSTQDSAPAVEFRAISLCQREWPPEDGQAPRLQPGESAPFLSFGSSSDGIPTGAWLPLEPYASEVLATLHALASRNGVVHNIPRQRQSPMENSPERKRSDDGMVVDADSEPSGLKGAGTATGYNASADWADLSDCVICLSSLGDDTWIRGQPLRTHCGHYFHAKCLQRHNRSAINHNGSPQRIVGCPNCRADDPLRGAQPAGGLGIKRWSLNRDICDNALEPGKGYRVVATLCQDPLAVLDSSLMFCCHTLEWPQDGSACHKQC